MVFRILIVFLLAATVPAWGAAPRNLCLSCHSLHFVERGRCSDCHRGNQESARKNISHSGLIIGKYARYTLDEPLYLNQINRMVEQYSCRRCHINNGYGTRLAVRLDVSATQKTPEILAGSIRRPAAAMPDFALDDGQITLLINAIFAGSKVYKVQAGAPVVVHFNGQNKKADVFTRLCGSCHRVLSERWGTLGAGNIGPNLSGLLTPYYPKTFKNADAWTVQGIKTWLNNPREIQQLARMRPIKLADAELTELVSILQVTSEYKNEALTSNHERNTFTRASNVNW